MPHYDHVLVTGASRGLGAALSEALLQRGHRVLMAARDAAEGERRCAALVAAHGPRIAWCTLDLADTAGIAAFAADAQQRHGPLDAVINNAGIGSVRPFADTPAEDIEHVIRVNLLAPMLLAHALLPGWRERRRGMVVNVASDLARRPLANMAPYVASKFGLLGFAGSLLREVKGQGVKVSTVLPGIIDTAFNGAVPGSKDPTWALQPAELAERIVDLLHLPEHMVVDELTIHPMQQDF